MPTRGAGVSVVPLFPEAAPRIARVPVEVPKVTTNPVSPGVEIDRAALDVPVVPMVPVPLGEIANRALLVPVVE